MGPSFYTACTSELYRGFDGCIWGHTIWGKRVLVWESETKNKILVNISYGHSSETAGEEIKFNRFKYIKK